MAVGCGRQGHKQCRAGAEAGAGAELRTGLGSGLGSGFGSGVEAGPGAGARSGAGVGEESGAVAGVGAELKAGLGARLETGVGAGAGLMRGESEAVAGARAGTDRSEIRGSRSPHLRKGSHEPQTFFSAAQQKRDFITDVIYQHLNT